MSGFTGEIPASLGWLQGSEPGRAWLAALPRAVDECAAHWRLRLTAPYPYGFTSLAIPATREDGSDAVLKVVFIDRETEHEAAALRRWDGDGAVRLLDHLASRNALLMERCMPGAPLSSAGVDVALEVLEGLLPRLWKPATPPFRSLAEEAERWAAGMRARWMDAGRPFPQRLLEATLDALGSLSSSQGEQVLLHQDLHAANVLASQREPWLVIDPKPLVGEREFGLAPIIRSSELGHGRREVLRRLDYLTATLGLDRERARLWCVGQTVAWSIGTDQLQRNIEIAGWLLEG